MTETGQLPAGLVHATRGENGRIHVLIGRARKTKQLYLSDAEARQLIDQLKLVTDWDTPEESAGHP